VDSASTSATPSLTLYGAAGSGSVAVEAALSLLGIPYELIEGATWAEASARDRVAARNPMRQIPTLVLPGGEVMTESAAILIWLGDLHPEAGLAPDSAAAARRPYLRWMSYVSSAIYALHWINDVGRIGARPAATRYRCGHERIAFCGRHGRALDPGRYLLGEQMTMSTCTSPSSPLRAVAAALHAAARR
jgi:GST-like protein